MIRTIVLGSVAAAAFAVGGLTATSAQAQEFPTYTCDFVRSNGFVAEGFRNCFPSENAEPEGPFFGPSVLISRFEGVEFFCRAGGFAQTPVRVHARACSRV
jgi:hypothetical protein